MKNGVSSPPSVEASLLMAKTAMRLRSSGPDMYTLTLPRRFKCSPTVNVDRLKLYNSPQVAARHNPPDPEPAPGPAELPVLPTTGAACPSRRRRAAPWSAASPGRPPRRSCRSGPGPAPPWAATCLSRPCGRWRRPANCRPAPHSRLKMAKVATHTHTHTHSHTHARARARAHRSASASVFLWQAEPMRRIEPMRRGTR